MKSAIVTAFLLLTCMIFCCCHEEGKVDLFENATVDTGYIQWNKQTGRQPKKDIIVSSADQSYVLTTPEGFELEVFSFTTSFMLNAYDSDLSVVMGKEFGYMRLTPQAIAFWDNDFVCEEELPFTLAVDTEYTLKLSKRAIEVRFEIYQDQLLVYEKDFSVMTNRNMGLMRGKPVFIVDQGDMCLTQSILDTPYSSPRVNVFGDSFVEGISLVDLGLDLNIRWVAQLRDSLREERCLIDGKGGEKISPEFLKRVMYINTIFPSDYVLLSIGTNNVSDVSDCIKQLAQLSEAIKKNRQIPVFATVTARSPEKYKDTAKLINDWIKSSGERFVDMHQAVTQPDNPAVWKEGYMMQDGIHPMPIAYQAMYELLLSTCPYFFD